MALTLDPRTDLAPPRHLRDVRTIGDYVPGLCSLPSLRALLACARQQFGLGDSQVGLTRVYDGRAYFQVPGDPTPYSMLVPADYADAIVTHDVTGARA